MFKWSKKGRGGFSGYIFPSLIIGSDIDLNNRCISGLWDFRARLFIYLFTYEMAVFDWKKESGFSGYIFPTFDCWLCY